MAKSITQNDITFSNYNNTDVLKVSSPLKYANYEGLDEDNFGIVNAVDIAWNGAQWPSDSVENVPSPINTTGDLIKAIKYASQVGGSLQILLHQDRGILEQQFKLCTKIY